MSLESKPADDSRKLFVHYNGIKIRLVMVRIFWGTFLTFFSPFSSKWTPLINWVQNSCLVLSLLLEITFFFYKTTKQSQNKIKIKNAGAGEAELNTVLDSFCPRIHRQHPVTYSSSKSSFSSSHLPWTP